MQTYHGSRYDELVRLTAEALGAMSGGINHGLPARPSYRPRYAATTFPPEPDTTEPSSSEEVITESDPDRVDADRVEHEPTIGSVRAAEDLSRWLAIGREIGAEHAAEYERSEALRKARLKRWASLGRNP